MKKILCIMDSLGSGGAERQLIGLASLLKMNGYNVTLMTYYPLFFYKNLVDKEAIPYIYVKGAENKLHRFFHLRKEIKKHNPDLVITFSPSAAQWITLIKLSGVDFRLIVSERSLTDYIGCKNYVRFQLYRLSKFVVTNSHKELINLQKRVPFLKNKLVHISNFVDFKDYYPSNEDRDYSVLKVVIVARLIPVKNALMFLDALKILIDQGISIHVKWYGVINDLSYVKEVCRKINNLNLNDFFELCGECLDIRAAYCAANLFCLPSLKEGHSNAISEAMCCGLPILCSNISDNPKLIMNGENGFLFNPLFVNDIADAFIKWNNLSLLEKMQFSKKSVEIALKRFSKKRFFDAYNNLLSQL